MWISNTATAVMMLPIGMAVVNLLGDRMKGSGFGVQDSGAENKQGTGNGADDAANLASSILLAIAYAASLGGFATLVGTPPNIYFAGYMRDKGLPIDFGRWMLFAMPLSWLYFLIAWWVLAFWL